MATRCFLISPTLARFRLTFRACLCTGTMRWKSSISKKGTGAITVDFKSYVVTEGTIALILPGRLHSIEQYMQESMEYENINFPSGHPHFQKKRTPAIPNFLRRCCRAFCPFRFCISRDLPAMRRLPPALTPTMKSAGRTRPAISSLSRVSSLCFFTFYSANAS